MGGTTVSLEGVVDMEEVITTLQEEEGVGVGGITTSQLIGGT